MIVAFLMAGHFPPYVRHMVESVHFHLGCEVVQCTDRRTEAVQGCKVVRRPFVSPLMCYRFEHMVEFGDDPVLWLDTDVIVKAHIGSVWLERFEVALTRRKDGPVGMPYNSGVMFSRCRDFWQACLEHTQTLDEFSQRWYGDQQAIARVADRFHVKQLSCDEYNWSPESEHDYSAAKIWHFKGAKRKPWMHL